MYPYHEDSNSYFSKIIHIEDMICIVKHRELYGNLWEVEIQQINGRTLHYTGDTATDVLINANIEYETLKNTYPEIFI
jgi:hypothetical protein